MRTRLAVLLASLGVAVVTAMGSAAAAEPPDWPRGEWLPGDVLPVTVR